MEKKIIYDYLVVYTDIYGLSLWEKSWSILGLIIDKKLTIDNVSICRLRLVLVTSVGIRTDFVVKSKSIKHVHLRLVDNIIGKKSTNHSFL